MAVGSAHDFVSFNARVCNLSIQRKFTEKFHKTIEHKYVRTWHVMSRLEKRTIKRYLGVSYLFLSWTIRRLRA